MNLRLFHALLILLSAALAVLFGIWCLNQYGRDAGIARLIAGVAAFAVSLGWWSTTRGSCARRGRCDDRGAPFAPGRLGWHGGARARVGGRDVSRARCASAPTTPLIDGEAGVLVMLAITLAVQGGVRGFFLYLRKRAKRIADIELDTEWSELQRRREHHD
jgi:hypothetical protein